MRYLALLMLLGLKITAATLNLVSSNTFVVYTNAVKLNLGLVTTNITIISNNLITISNNLTTVSNGLVTYSNAQAIASTTITANSSNLFSTNIAAGSLNIGGGSLVTGILTATAVLDFPSITASTNADLTITVTGVAANNAVVLGLPATATEGIAFNAFVSSGNTVTVRAMNYNTNAIDPASATYRVTVIKY